VISDRPDMVRIPAGRFRMGCEGCRPAARQPEAVDTSTSHIGFRCVIR
jgi:formylglycine-generating enzyme required for sulfatase activity